MKTKLLLVLLTSLLFPLFFASASALSCDVDVSFKGTNMVFKTDVSCQSDLTYVSENGDIKFNLKENSFRQSHNIQLWNLDFTTFNYNLKLSDNEGNLVKKEGSFTVVPADPSLVVKKTEESKKALSDMTREELLSYLDELLKK